MKHECPADTIFDVIPRRFHSVRIFVWRLALIGWRDKLLLAIKPILVARFEKNGILEDDFLFLVSWVQDEINPPVLGDLYVSYDFGVAG